MRPSMWRRGSRSSRGRWPEAGWLLEIHSFAPFTELAERLRHKVMEQRGDDDRIRPLFDRQMPLVTAGQRESAQQAHAAWLQRRRTAQEWLRRREDGLDWLRLRENAKKNPSRKKLGVIRNALDVYHEAHKFFGADETLCCENAVWEQIHIVESDLDGVGIGTLELLEAEDQSVIDRSREADAPSR